MKTSPDEAIVRAGDFAERVRRNQQQLRAELRQRYAIGDHVVYLETVNARIPVGFVATPGARVPPGTAQARAHSQIGSSAPVLDASDVLAGVSCVAVPIPLGGSEVAAVSTLVAAPHPQGGTGGCHPKHCNASQRTTAWLSALKSRSSATVQPVDHRWPLIAVRPSVPYSRHRRRCRRRMQTMRNPAHKTVTPQAVSRKDPGGHR
jgi:hypothetical protein